MKTEQSKSERTRQFIIESTADIFNKKGYAGTSLTDLTAATSLTKGSIYGNFENKEEVAVAAFDYNWDRVKQNIAQKMADCGTFKEKLMVYTTIYLSTANDTFSRGGCPILNTAVEADDTNPILRERAAKALMSWKTKIVSLVKDGIKNAEFSADTDVQQFALTTIALIEGGIMMAKVTGSRDYLTIVMKSLAQQIEAICL